MKIITVSEFRKNIKFWAEVAEKEKVLVNRGPGQAFAIVPINELEDEGYNQEFINDIKVAMEEYKEGDYVTIKDPTNVWDSIK